MTKRCIGKNRQRLALFRQRYSAGDHLESHRSISGSQDAIGLVFPGLVYMYYENGYWPTRIQHRLDGSLLRFVKNALYFIPLGPRINGYNVLADTVINPQNAKALADAAEAHWEAILKQDLPAFGESMRSSFEAQVTMFPHMLNKRVTSLIDEYRSCALGWKLSGTGGGYLILVSDHPIPDSIRVIARHESE